MFWFSLIIFIASAVGMGVLIIRAFPRLIHVAVVQHKKFSLFGIENIHILEYKAPSEVLRKKILISFEKTLRKIRGVVLKLDTILSRAISAVQRKNQASTLFEVREEYPLPAAARSDISKNPEIQNAQDVLVIKEKLKTRPPKRRVVRDITGRPKEAEPAENNRDTIKKISDISF